MQFTETIKEAEFLRRYKRFFADVKFGQEIVVSHVPNTGSLKTCLFEGAPCIVTESTNPKRKLKATLQFLKTPTSWVGVNTALPNGLAYEAWEAKLISDWHPYSVIQREYKISKESRLDLVMAANQESLTNKTKLHFVEIKNVTYAINGTAYFPDAETTRGQKHLGDLMRLMTEGHTAEILFVVQRQDCLRFAPADEIDPEYGRLLRLAKSKGVVVRALACNIDPLSGVTLQATPLFLDF
jgi:sugar fermentation stimulation protein A